MITVIYSDVCNFFSICNAFAHQEIPLKIAVTPEDVPISGPMVLPGVGAFSAEMQSLRSWGQVERARQYGRSLKLLTSRARYSN